MIYKLDEFQEEYIHQVKRFIVLENDEQYVHEMTAEKLIQFIGAEGVKSVSIRKTALLKYLQWLYEKYNIDVLDTYYTIMKTSNSDFVDKNIYFFSFDELQYTLEKGILQAELANANRDFNGFKTFCYLQWIGITLEEILSIKLSDVSTEGKSIYIPYTNRTVNITNATISNWIAEYKSMSGIINNKGVFTLYAQPSLIRTTNTRCTQISEKTIYNLRSAFDKIIGDARFEKKRIYYAGRYIEILEYENKIGREISFTQDIDFLSGIFVLLDGQKNFVNMKDYKKFKQQYLEWLN